MNHYRILSTLGLIAVLSGCLDTQNNPKQSIGTLLGAGAGALLGSQFGDGKGQLVAVAIGTLGGAYLLDPPRPRPLPQRIQKSHL